MANYTIPEIPEYIEEIRKLERTDPANAELFNALFQRLIENTHAVKLETDGKSNSGHTHLPGDCGLGKNLTLTGAATGTYNGQAPASFLIPDRKGCRFVVGTSTAGHTLKDCDYLCDGTADQVEINNAISALPSTGGEVVVLAGTYNITASITVNKNNIKLRGNGNATVIKRMWDLSYINGVIYVTGNDCSVSNFYFLGDKDTYTSSGNASIYVNSITTRNIITNNICDNERFGIYLAGKYHIVLGNICKRNFYGIFLPSYSNASLVSTHNVLLGNCCCNNAYGIDSSANDNQYNAILGNICNNNSSNGIAFVGCNNTISGNTCNGNPTGISAVVCTNSAITGNTCNGNSHYGILVNGSNGGPSSYNSICGNTCNNNRYGIYLGGSGSNFACQNTVTGNTIYRDSYESSQHSIYIESNCNNNLIADNMIWGKNYTNSGTGNTFVNNKYN